MSFVYRFNGSDSLYVNLVRRYACSNNCKFCSIPSKPGTNNVFEIMAGTSLYLSKASKLHEIVRAIRGGINEDREIAIVGLGEPLLNFDLVEEVVGYIKRNHEIRVRIDTNGLVGCWADDPVKRLEKAGLDEIRISLNAITSEDYKKLCKPKVENAFDTLVEFVREAVESSIDTKVSFVTGFEGIGSEGLVEFAQSLGVREEDVILRPYVHL